MAGNEKQRLWRYLYRLRRDWDTYITIRRSQSIKKQDLKNGKQNLQNQGRKKNPQAEPQKAKI